MIPNAVAIVPAIPNITEMQDETPRNNLLHSAKYGVYKRGIRAAKMEIPDNPRNSIPAASWDSKGFWFLGIHRGEDDGTRSRPRKPA
jgi:hypothetical protein